MTPEVLKNTLREEDAVCAQCLRLVSKSIEKHHGVPTSPPESYYPADAVTSTLPRSQSHWDETLAQEFQPFMPMAQNQPRLTLDDSEGPWHEEGSDISASRRPSEDGAADGTLAEADWLPRELVSKFKLLRFFESEIMERLYGADSPLTYVDEELTSGMGFVHKWYRCKQAIVFRLSSGTVQFNFYDHTKLFLSCDGLVVSAIDAVDKTDGVPVLRTWTLAEMVAIAHPRRSAAEAAAAASGATAREHFPYYFHTKPSERRFVRQLMKKLRYVRDVLMTTTSASHSQA